jgi:predicted hydrocarbon binding protein
LKCEINRYGRRLAKAFADKQQQDDLEKFVRAVEQLAEEVERNELRIALMERAGGKAAV